MYKESYPYLALIYCMILHNVLHRYVVMNKAWKVYINSYEMKGCHAVIGENIFSSSGSKITAQTNTVAKLFISNRLCSLRYISQAIKR